MASEVTAVFVVPISAPVDFDADVVYLDEQGESHGGMTRRENTTLRGTDYELWEILTSLDKYQALCNRYTMLRLVRA